MKLGLILLIYVSKMLMIYRHFKNPSICKALIDRTKMIRNKQKDDEEVTDIRYD